MLPPCVLEAAALSLTGACPCVAQRVVPSGRCHENEIVREFRTFYPRYRRRDMGRSKDGVNLSDDKIGDLVGSWNREVGRPGERTPTGYWKGISVNATQVVRYI